MDNVQTPLAQEFVEKTTRNKEQVTGQIRSFFRDLRSVMANHEQDLLGQVDRAYSANILKYFREVSTGNVRMKEIEFRWVPGQDNFRVVTDSLRMTIQQTLMLKETNMETNEFETSRCEASVAPGSLNEDAFLVGPSATAAHNRTANQQSASPSLPESVSVPVPDCDISNGQPGYIRPFRLSSTDRSLDSHEFKLAEKVLAAFRGMLFRTFWRTRKVQADIQTFKDVSDLLLKVSQEKPSAAVDVQLEKNLKKQLLEARENFLVTLSASFKERLEIIETERQRQSAGSRSVRQGLTPSASLKNKQTVTMPTPRPSASVLSSHPGTPPPSFNSRALRSTGRTSKLGLSTVQISPVFSASRKRAQDASQSYRRKRISNGRLMTELKKKDTPLPLVPKLSELGHSVSGIATTVKKIKTERESSGMTTSSTSELRDARPGSIKLNVQGKKNSLTANAASRSSTTSKAGKPLR